MRIGIYTPSITYTHKYAKTTIYIHLYITYYVHLSLDMERENVSKVFGFIVNQYVHLLYMLVSDINFQQTFYQLASASSSASLASSGQQLAPFLPTATHSSLCGTCGAIQMSKAHPQKKQRALWQFLGNQCTPCPSPNSENRS